MKIRGKFFRSIWREGHRLFIIDQTELPVNFVTREVRSSQEVADCIINMNVRGAPLIGVTAAYGMAMAMSEDSTRKNIRKTYQMLNGTRPTAINLKFSLDRMHKILESTPEENRSDRAWSEADKIAEEDVEQNKLIGDNGLRLIEEIYKTKKTVNILTHCNAGWLATVDYGTALSPIFQAHDKGINIHVWVDETRPRNQGLLTAWELASHGIQYSLIVDNAGGHLMQNQQVDMVIVGADRVSAAGDVCNKIGTYLKALSARENKIPFFAAVPTPTIDWEIINGLKDIPIEERDVNEVLMNTALSRQNKYTLHGLGYPKVSNPGFDVTPAHLVSGLITEKKIVQPVSITTMEELKKALGKN